MLSTISRGSRSKVFSEKAVHKSFIKLKGDHQQWSLVLMKFQISYTKKALSDRCFLVSFTEFLNLFYKTTTNSHCCLASTSYISIKVILYILKAFLSSRSFFSLSFLLPASALTKSESTSFNFVKLKNLVSKLDDF